MVELTNRMWFSVVCTLIDNDTRHRCGQNVVRVRLSCQKPLQTHSTYRNKMKKMLGKRVMTSARCR